MSIQSSVNTTLICLIFEPVANHGATYDQTVYLDQQWAFCISVHLLPLYLCCQLGLNIINLRTDLIPSSSREVGPHLQILIVQCGVLTCIDQFQFLIPFFFVQLFHLYWQIYFWKYAPHWIEKQLCRRHIHTFETRVYMQ